MQRSIGNSVDRRMQQSSHGPVSQSNITPVSSLPSGWRKEETVKQSGLSSGKSEVFFISPDGRKVRTKQEMQMILGSKYDLNNFDWRSGRFISHPYARPTTGKKPGLGQGLESVAKTASKLDSSIKLPARQTASIFKRPVTIVRSETESKKSDVKHGPQEPPHQLFWEKRLEGLQTTDPETGESRRKMVLPKGIQSAGGPTMAPEQLVQSLAHSLHTSTGAVSGQQQPRAAFDKNPGVAVKSDQPMVRHVLVSEDDVRRQETRVEDARRKLKLAMQAFNVERPSIRVG